MPRLADATRVLLGSQAAQRVYLGSTLAWSEGEVEPPEPTPPSYVGGSDSLVTWTTTSVTQDVPGSQAGDVALAFATVDGDADELTPSDSGWAPIALLQGGVGRVHVLAKTLTGSLAPVTWTWPTSRGHHVWVVVYRGAQQPAAVLASYGQAASQAGITLPAFTTTVDLARIVVIGWHNNNGANPSLPAPLTTRFGANVAYLGGVIADQVVEEAGTSVGPIVYTAAAGTTNFKQMVIAAIELAPATA